jgi:hypothetical protein
MSIRIFKIQLLIFKIFFSTIYLSTNELIFNQIDVDDDDNIP